MKRKLLYIFFMTTILLSVFNLTTFAADTISGTYGNVKYVLDWDTMTLTISGSGEISNAALLDGSSLDMYGYKKVIINEGITKVTNDIMSGSSLTSVSIPSSVVYFDSSNITKCQKLTTISVNSNNKNYVSTGNVLFNKNKSELICYPAGKTGTTYTIPSTVKKIGKSAFSKSKITSITIPSNVTTVENGVFSSCSALTTVNILPGITEITNNMFSSCSALTKITLPNGITKIGGSAFRSCDVLTSITIPSSVNYIEEAAFEYCDGLTSVNFSSAALTLKEDAFRSCKTLSNITGAENILNIGSHTFYNCPALSSINVGDKLTQIGEAAFGKCESLNSFYFGNGLTAIDERAFYDCINLKQVIIPKNVNSIGVSPFQGCTSVTSISVNANNTNYISLNGILCTADKTKLIQYPSGKNGSCTIPNTITIIADSAFDSSAYLTSVTIPNSVRIIESDAFYGCEKLTSIVIPNSVTELGDGVFDYCESLTNVVLSSNIKVIESGTFEDCPSLTSIVIPPSVTTISSTSFDDSNPNMVIKGKNGSYAQTFANSNGYTFTALTTYTITYNANGGSNAPTAQPKFQGITTDLYTQEPTRANYKFLGWSTSSTSKTVTYKPGVTYSANANITLYAVWEYLYPTDVKLSTYNITLFVGDNEKVYTTITPTTAQNKTLNWTSENTSIATVTQNDGVITAISPGTTKVNVVTGDGAIKETVTVTVIKLTNNIDFSLTEAKQSPTSSNIKITIDGDKSLVKNIKWAYGSQNETYFTSSGTTIDLSKLNTMVDKNGIYTFCLIDVDDNKKIKTINVSEIAIGQPQFTNSSRVLETENELYIPINFDEIDENIAIYIALYDDGKLTKLEKTLCVPSENIGKKEFRKTFNVMYPKKGYELKAFVWNEKLMPYLNGISLKSNSSSTEQIFEGIISADEKTHDFSVSENKAYNIKSYIDDTANVALYGYLFDSEGNLIAMDENDADKGFEFNVNLETGKTYSLMIINLNDNTSGSYMVVVK